MIQKICTHLYMKSIICTYKDFELKCCVSSPFFPDPDPRIRVFHTDADPDPGDPKKNGSGSYLDMFLMFSKINNLQNENILITEGLFVNKGPGDPKIPDPQHCFKDKNIANI